MSMLSVDLSPILSLTVVLTLDFDLLEGLTCLGIPRHVPSVENAHQMLYELINYFLRSYTESYSSFHEFITPLLGGCTASYISPEGFSVLSSVPST